MTEPMKPSVTQADMSLADAIIDQITSRKGLRHEFDNIDVEIQEEIRHEFAAISARHREAHTRPATDTAGDALRWFTQQIFNGLDTGMIEIASLADETLANVLRRGRAALSQPSPAGEYSQSAMLGYGHAAYCAGWKAAIKAAMGDPDELTENHGYEWLRDNPPAHLAEPLWRAKLPPLSTNSKEGSGDRP